MPKECGCEIDYDYDLTEHRNTSTIIFCPLHAAAEEMKWQRDELLDAGRLLMDMSYPKQGVRILDWYDAQARWDDVTDAIAKAEAQDA